MKRKHIGKNMEKKLRKVRNRMEENVEKDMTPVLLEDLGMRFPTEKSNRKIRYGLYQCQYCGKKFNAIVACVKSRNTKSCGCLIKIKAKSNFIKLGLRQHRLYNTWTNMRERCNNPKIKHYIHYGGRGIKVCDRWWDIANFIEDMYPSYQEGLTLDRIDVNGNYQPENCRWVSTNTQARNTRDIMVTNTSGYRGVSLNKRLNKWVTQIEVNNIKIYLGVYQTALEAAKAYERYIHLNNLEHNFTPASTPEEIKELEANKETQQ